MPRGKNKGGMPDRRPAPPNYRIQRYFTLGQLLIVVLDRKSAAMTKWLILGNLCISALVSELGQNLDDRH